MSEVKSSQQVDETKSNDEKEEQSTENRQSMNYAIIGGVVGAGIGLLSNPGTGKKVVDSLGKSDVMKAASKELRRSAQEFLTEQAIITLRQSATGYMSRLEGGLLSPKKKKEEASENSDGKVEKNENSSNQSEELEEIKEENKNLNDRLERIEEMLNSLVDSKK
ncbi:GvpT/GvpP family gas vesicle accessory protein [Rossellomorea vietnamensis]|uniref:Gas vesicle protein GvpP n=1 Tax=Rossellomorea vietnamensis TaxID=218284 RepID=A0A0P6VZ48_9BACI|nr:GvpT/GvpP family gas vesicle accessory protein [Rossellomorea vietnamensis]KPL58216.1 gas vesicle protein GvpP [Rossellomorea vietnamensis]